jgi:hypothetical protein
VRVTPSTVRDALKNALNITGLRAYDTIPENVVPPAAVVGQLAIDWDLVMTRGADTANVDVIVVAGRMSDRASQDFLDGLLTASGASSVKTKLEADRTLGGEVSTLRVRSADPIQMSVSGVEMLAYRFSVVLYG